MNQFNFEKYPEEIAERLQELAQDMDKNDYTETQEQEQKQILKVLEWLQATAQNEYNGDEWRTFWRLLETI